MNLHREMIVAFFLKKKLLELHKNYIDTVNKKTNYKFIFFTFSFKIYLYFIPHESLLITTKKKKNSLHFFLRDIPIIFKLTSQCYSFVRCDTYWFNTIFILFDLIHFLYFNDELLLTQLLFFSKSHEAWYGSSILN